MPIDPRYAISEGLKIEVSRWKVWFLILLKMLTVGPMWEWIFSWDAENGLNAYAQTLNWKDLWCMHVCHLPESTLHPPLPLEMYKTADCIFTFDYIQTEYIIMEIKQSNSTNSNGQIILYRVHWGKLGHEVKWDIELWAPMIFLNTNSAMEFYYYRSFQYVSYNLVYIAAYQPLFISL